MPTPLVFDLLARDNASKTFRAVGNEAVLAATKAGKATTEIERAGIRMNAVGAKLSRSMTLPIVAGAAVAVDQAAKYQSAMTLIQTAGGETVKKATAIQKGLLGVAKATGTSLDQLSEGIYTVAKAGGQKWTATEQLNIMKAAAEGAKAENVDLGTATSALTSVMSGYGLSAKQAVSAENEIIRASGLAKTNMSDFAGSLSNVIPLASSLHISFAQVGAAIATMTQHGESAQRSTENLNNLIRNLAGGNNVAVKAMGQLGLKSQDVAATLSKSGPDGGLYGALNMVEQAMAKNTRGGKIVVSAFKVAQNATKDLGVELAHMPSHLQEISKQFASGKMSYADYNAAVRSLGGASYVMGKQFAGSVMNAKGFSDALKSGNPQVQTAAQAFQRLLGGATGLNAALMLSGTSAKTFAGDAKSISGAARQAGGDVLGWSKTQNTFAVRLDKAKESLQVLAVEAGTELLPALSKIATAGEKAIGWVDGLSHSQKEVLGWSLGVVAALGPVLSIGGRLVLLGSGIGKFATGAATQLASLAGASEASSLAISTSMSRITAGLAGVGIGVAAGELTKNSSTATKAIGALTAAGAGAAIGFGVGGPLGAAIGGIGAGVGDLAVQFLSAGNKGESAADKAAAAARRARQAIAQQRQAVDTLTGSIDADSNAIGRNTRAQVANDLKKSGALANAAKLNIDPGIVTQAALGQQRAETQLRKLLNQRSGQALLSGVNGLPQQREILALTSALAKEGVNVAKAGRAEDLLAAATGKLNLATRSVSDETKRYGTVLDKSTIAGRANTKFIGDHVGALDRELHTGKLTNAQWVAQIGTLQKQLTQYGFNKRAVGDYIAGFAHVPKSVLTQLLADPKIANSAIGAVLAQIGKVPKQNNTALTAADNATPKIRTLQGYINSLSHSHPTVKIDADESAFAAAVARARAQLQSLGSAATVSNTGSIRGTLSGGAHGAYAAGGSVKDGFFTVGERGYELGYKRGSQVQIYSNAQSKAMTGMDRVPGFAGGTTSSNQAQITAFLANVLHFSRNGIAATEGNWKVESNFNPAAWNPSENAHGLSQDEGGRWTAMQRLAEKLGLSTKSMTLNLKNFQREIKQYPTLLHALQAGTASAASLAARFDSEFERSSGSTHSERMANATRIAAQLKGQNLNGIVQKAYPGRPDGAPGSVNGSGPYVPAKPLPNDTFKAVTPALTLFAKGAASTVAKLVAQAVKPPVTSTAGLAAQLTYQQTRARNLTESSAQARNVFGQYAKHAAAQAKALHDVTVATDQSTRAADHQAAVADKVASKAKSQADAMKSTTKVEKAAKAQAEAQANALQKVANRADAAAKATDKANAREVAAATRLANQAKAKAQVAKDAWDKASAAAKAAQSAAQDAATALVTSLQSQADALVQAVQGFQQTIASGLTQGTDLATLWGQVTSAQSDATDQLTTANQNLADAQQAVADAQDAINKAQPDTSSLLAAQNAAAQAQAQFTQAHSTLLAAQQAVAAGAGTPAQYAALTAAQAHQSDTVQALAAANADLASAQQAVSQATGPTQDDLAALTTAQQNLATATTAAATAASNAASNTGSYANLQAQFNATLAATQNFAADLSKLTAAGAGQDLVSQIAAMGSQTGDALAQQLLAAGPQGIAALQKSMTDIQNVAGSEASSLSKGFYSAGQNSLMQLVAGMQKQFPALTAALAPMVAQLQAMFTIAPTVIVPGGSSASNSTGSATKTVTISGHTTLADLAKKYNTTVTAIDALNPSLSTAGGAHAFNSGVKVNVPGFAGGVSNYAGGLAYVHADELVSLPRGSNVHTKTETKNIFDTSGLERRLDDANSRLESLAQGVADATDARGAQLYERAARRTAGYNVRAIRRAGQFSR